MIQLLLQKEQHQFVVLVIVCSDSRRKRLNPEWNMGLMLINRLMVLIKKKYSYVIGSCYRIFPIYYSYFNRNTTLLKCCAFSEIDLE